ncbi:MAG: hypothetical protein ACLFPS_07400 [Clostridia bacterium]
MNSIDYSPDGSVLAASWWEVDLYNAEDLTHLKEIQGGHEARVRFSHTGDMLGTARHSKAWLWKKMMI